MFRNKMDLRIKMAILPFTDFQFYRRDYIAEIGQSKSTPEYKNYMKKTFIKDLLPALHQTERVEQLDEIELLAEKFYSYRSVTEWTERGAQPERFYMQRLKELSRLFLTHRNGKVALKYWESTDEKQNANSMFSAYRGIYKVALWNSLNRMMCTDLMVMIYLLSNGLEDEHVLGAYHALVYLPDTQLERVLDKGVAETHLHLSASGQFSLNWQQIMAPVRSGQRKADEHHTYIDRLTGRDPDLQLYTLAAASVRLLLGSYLQSIEGHRITANRMLPDYLQDLDSVGKTGAGGIKPFIRLVEFFYAGSNLKEHGYDEKSLQELFEDVRHELTGGTARSDQPHRLWSERMAAMDSLYPIFGAHAHTSLENLLLFRSLRYMLQQPADRLFTKLFWQYIRIKNQQFTRAVQRNHIRGLPYFLDYFDKATDRKISENNLEYYGFMLHHQLQNPHLKKLEIRIAPPKKGSVQEMKTEAAGKLLSFFKAYQQILEEKNEAQQGGFAPLAGIIYHFIKMPDEKHQEKCWFDYSEQDRNKEKLSFKTNQINYERQMIAVRELREHIPGLADYIVGIDAANLETAAEPWVFAPIFRQARNSDTHKLVYPGYPLRKISNLGLTYHAGEDFRHMLTGLRHIHEVIDHFQFRAGDRIGHGMVLGVEVRKWALRNRVVILPRVEYLENLLWVWGMCRSGHKLTDVDVAALEHKIVLLAEGIYPSTNGITVYLLWKAYQSKFAWIGESMNKVDDSTRDAWFCEQLSPGIQWTEDMLRHTYHCKCFMNRMQEPIEVEITSYEEVLIHEVQQIVLRKVSSDGIIIETNPTSNAAIGEIEHIFEHYIHNLNRRGLPGNQQPGDSVMVSINTDDPVVFNTNIDNEFAYIFYSLHEKGYAREDILGWIDHVREMGLTSSFIETKQIPIPNLIREMTAIISSLEEYLYGS
ncbi:hypothetical protein [Paenibacillus sp. FJAT-26967]|uniref:hypothetical protein n=1 Tax=Paenibacillus sp. FJAT-26967 TaxID=1729690 RepID=UPI00083893E8|nr:hypothetical protein [Paenibacillus sp. FJAT-26967]